MIYKGGQGYWVRMMTAVLTGILVAAVASWTWTQMQGLPLPTPRWALTVENIQNAPPVGTTLQVEHESPTALESIGTVAVDPKQAGGGQLVVGTILMASGRSMSDASRLRWSENGATKWTSTVAGPRPIPVVEPIYVQAAAASLVVVIGAFLIFRYVALKPGTVEFLIATDAEMKKVNWSTRKTVIDSTWVVVGACVILVTILFLLDIALSRLFHAFNILQS